VPKSSQLDGKMTELNLGAAGEGQPVDDQQQPQGTRGGQGASIDAAPKVLLACEWFVKYTAGLARGLIDVGCDVTLLTRDHDLEFGDEPGAMHAFVESTLDGAGRHLELGGRVRDPSALRDVLALRRRIDAWSPDVVHIQDSLTHDMRLAVAAGFPRRRYAVTVHDPAPHPGDPQPSWRIRTVRYELRRHAGLIFVHSEGMVEELRAADHARREIEVVPHGFGVADVAPLPDQPSLLFFGRISHYKGVDVLLDAMPIVWQTLPEVTLTLAGSGELPSSAVLDDPRVKLRHEHVRDDELPGLFAASTAVVLPYRQASQSGVGSEAKQYGRPVIATDVGGLPELVGVAGRVVSPEDPVALAAAIVEVGGTPGLAAELGRHGIESAAEAGWKSVGAKTLAAYRRYLL
jgi:glycosyltransferase involved in cell wall biosynthesis